ncbi:MAG: DUF1501 domain-containing protein [Phycisphaeraceae bacterium]
MSEIPSQPGRDLLNRRGFLSHTGTGAGAMALLHLLGRDGLLADEAAPIRPTIDASAPAAPRLPHHTAKAQQVLVIFCSGALSHMDTFDYKPELIKRHDQPMPGGEGLVTFQGENGNISRPLWRFRRRGQCGKLTSDLLPHLGALSDDLCFIHSMKGKTNTHGPGENLMSTGYTLDGFPSMGAWTTYALGSEVQNLPAYVALADPRGVPQSSVNNWGPGFLPAVFQGTPFNSTNPIRNLARPSHISSSSDKASRTLLKNLNEHHQQQRFPEDSQLAARIASYELAARMQLSVPDLADLSSEPQHIRDMYGADDPENKLKSQYADNCILARRLLERGVRFVQLFNGAYAMGEGVGNWDGHRLLQDQYNIHGPVLDQPTAALIKDLKQRGMFENTLIVFCTEFGRMPVFQKGTTGRDHNPEGFTCMLAGAGVKAPFSYGQTDELGYRAVENVVTVHDFHATILHLLGLDHRRLTYYHNGFERRLTDVHGHVVTPILS